MKNNQKLQEIKEMKETYKVLDNECVQLEKMIDFHCGDEDVTILNALRSAFENLNDLWSDVGTNINEAEEELGITEVFH